MTERGWLFRKYAVAAAAGLGIGRVAEMIAGPFDPGRSSSWIALVFVFWASACVSLWAELERPQ